MEGQDFVGQQQQNAAGGKGNDNPMAELLAQSFEVREFQHGDIVEGTIVHVSPTEVLIDVGAKSEGVLAAREWEKMSPEERNELEVGKRVLVYVLTPEDKGGNVVLSLSRAQLERDWREAERRFREAEAFPCVIAGYNKGGLIAHVGKVRGFIPASQLINPPREGEEGQSADLAQMVGRECQVKVIEVDRKRNRLILSQRAALRELRQEQKEKLLHSLEEGVIVRGRVSNLCDFGAFVNLGGADGLIHISELSWGRVSHPSEVLSVGDEVEVYVLNVEPERQRIGLSLKRLQPEPWSLVAQKYSIDQIVKGTVTKLTAFGAFVRLENEIEGLIHISELAERHITHPKELLKEGQELNVRIIRIDAERKRIGLSLKGTEEMPEVDWQVADEPETDLAEENSAVGESAEDAE